MVEFQILSGIQAGRRWPARRFPVRIGRAAGNDLRFEEEGVWDDHLEISLDSRREFVVAVQPSALLTVNREPVANPHRLRNGDSLELGSIRLRFWLGNPPLRALKFSEWFVWTVVVAVCAVQIALVHWLLN